MALERIRIKPFFNDQQQLLFWERLVGYCGDKPGMQVQFLAGNNCSLTLEEKADVVAYVIEHVGDVRETMQTQEIFRVLEHRRNLAGG